MQFLRQEAHSLKEELKIARMVVLFLFLVKCIDFSHVCPIDSG